MTDSDSDSDHDTVEPLIPWYANGTLEIDGRRKVDLHVRDCASCRDLLDQAREQVRFSRVVGADASTGEVHPLLLTRFSEDPAQLDDETVRWIRARLETSPLSREALQRLQEVADVDQPRMPGREETGERSGAGAGRIWAWISGTFLRPIPALAYLLLLLILVPSVWVSRGPSAPARLPRIVAAVGDSTLRAEPSTSVPPLELPRSYGVVILELVTELSPADLEQLGASFRVEITRSDEVVSSIPLAPDRLRMRDDRAVVTLTLDPLRFGGGPHEILIRAEKPGDPIDGQPLFRRAVRFTAD